MGRPTKQCQAKTLTTFRRYMEFIQMHVAASFWRINFYLNFYLPYLPSSYDILFVAIYPLTPGFCRYRLDSLHLFAVYN